MKLSCQRLMSRIQWSVRYRGIGFTTLALMLQAIGLGRTPWFVNLRQKQFDRRHRVDTAGSIALCDLGFDEFHVAQGVECTPSHPELVGEVLSGLPIDRSRYTLIDMGSGKGLVTLLASMIGFRQIIGVELSHDLCEIARKNLERFAERNGPIGQISIACCDVTEFEFPQQPLVVYFFNPFKDQIMLRVLERLQASYLAHPRQMVIVYNNPQQEEIVEKFAFLQPLSCHSTTTHVRLFGTSDHFGVTGTSMIAESASKQSFDSIPVLTATS